MYRYTFLVSIIFDFLGLTKTPKKNSKQARRSLGELLRRGQVVSSVGKVRG